MLFSIMKNTALDNYIVSHQCYLIFLRIEILYKLHINSRNPCGYLEYLRFPLISDQSGFTLWFFQEKSLIQ